MTTKLKWDDSYSVNDPELDAQHQRLFSIINSIPDEFNNDVARQILLRFITHANEHFATEEQMMKDIGYPQLEKHKNIHSDLLLQLGNIATNNFPDQQSLTDFKTFISDWIYNHFLKEDMDYFLFSKQEKE